MPMRISETYCERACDSVGVVLRVVLNDQKGEEAHEPGPQRHRGILPCVTWGCSWTIVIISGSDASSPLRVRHRRTLSPGFEGWTCNVTRSCPAIPTCSPRRNPGLPRLSRNKFMAGVPFLGLGGFQLGGNIGERLVLPMKYSTGATHRCHCSPSYRLHSFVPSVSGRRNPGPACVVY